MAKHGAKFERRYCLLRTRTVLVSQAQTIETMIEGGGLHLGSSMESGLKFDLGAAALQAVSRGELQPNQTMTIKKVDWARTR